MCNSNDDIRCALPYPPSEFTVDCEQHDPSRQFTFCRKISQEITMSINSRKPNKILMFNLEIGRSKNEGVSPSSARGVHAKVTFSFRFSESRHSRHPRMRQQRHGGSRPMLSPARFSYGTRSLRMRHQLLQRISSNAIFKNLLHHSRHCARIQLNLTFGMYQFPPTKSVLSIQNGIRLI